jgi:hypothetical protein
MSTHLSNNQGRRTLIPSNTKRPVNGAQFRYPYYVGELKEIGRVPTFAAAYVGRKRSALIALTKRSEEL